jgi:ParB family chromosome partitioning protein
MPTPPAKRSALGKGLESLLPSRSGSAPSIATAAPIASAGKPLEIGVELIDRNPFQTRTVFDEAKARRARRLHHGVGRSPAHRRAPRTKKDGRFTLITGERRWLASKIAGKPTVPAIVREVSNLQAMEMTIVENLQRTDLNPMEQAHAFDRLSHDFHMTQAQMAERTGKDRTSVANFLRLLKLPEPIQKLVEAGELSFGHARALLALESAEAITAAAQKVQALNLSVRATENYIQNLIQPGSKIKARQTSKARRPQRARSRRPTAPVARSQGDH